MNKKLGFIATTLLVLALAAASIGTAEAKRFGGGQSFGSRPSYSTPYQRPSAAPQPSRPANQPQDVRPNPAQQPARPGWGSGLMGMLGGLALGGLIGSMLSGAGFHGLNMLDFLIFGAIAFLLYRLFAARAGRAQPAASNMGGTERVTPHAYNKESYGATGNGAGFDTDVLFNKQGGSAYQADSGLQAATLPAGFDEKAFLAGAENAFRHLQQAWDQRDLADIRGLTTDKVFAEIQSQLKASSEPNRTDVLKVHAELLEVREVGNELEAVVMFDTIIREEADVQAQQVREVWHFIKPKNSTQPKWFLDGIQQLAD